MNIKYLITESSISFDNQNFTTYGIAAVEKSSEKICSELSDVSLNKAFVLHLVGSLNSEKIELCHFKDVVTDELNR